MMIEKDKAVSLDYTLSDETGQVIETSKGREPLNYIHGTGVIKGFEQAMTGRSVNDSFSFTVNPSEGYGEHRKELVFEVSKEQLGGVPDLKEGMPLRVQTNNGAMVVRVSKIESDKVILDANHPLAGKILNFDVQVLEVRDATPEELEEAYHVHDEGCGSSCGSSCGDGCGSGGCGPGSCCS
jgi:FKBP-type peptidyl-prolyl cis-trans isomerase SlyD